MFGYILPERPHLYIKDLELYQSFYCGVCKSMGGNFCKRSQFAINYDITFFCGLIHNYLGEDVELEKLKCITKPFSGRKMVKDNPLTKLVACLNVLLANHKLSDDILDGKKSRKVVRAIFATPYQKAKTHFPEADKIITVQNCKLHKMEEEGEESLDKVSDTFGVLISQCMVATVDRLWEEKAKKSEVLVEKKPEIDIHFKNLCYNIGKWIYLIDAIDDIQEDSESGNYNPFLQTAKGFSTKMEYLSQNQANLNFTFFTILNKIREEFLNTTFKYNTDLIENIVFRGMEIATKAILKGEEWNNFKKS